MEEEKNYFDIVMREGQAIVHNEGSIHQVDSLGRLVFPKNLRQKYGITPGDRMEFYTIEYNGEVYVGVRVSKRYGSRIEYLRAKEVLDDLGIEIPQKLTDAINGVM